ncbi:hypothetical protein D3227_26595 [Mesorhizobium waimense]|uniref:Lipoprotein n=1 Tax=Mesorhizobium waimense TaxID=1300307 RepID=A0A3A5KC30_9HYPH|nr:hypothetical protein [Mesorhizobium waimense]RJT32590.1 hypothetical protein D3227_26595 [Mesorhizobium waimense]
MKQAIILSAVLPLLALAGCNSTADQWQQATSPSFAGRYEQAKAICEGRAAENFAGANSGLLIRAVSSDAVFRGCMAEQGFVKKSGQ